MTNESDRKKVLIMLGSPRKKGNSATLAEQIALGAQSAGAEVESLFLHEMNIQPCQSCYACQTPDSQGCAIDDAMQPVYGKLIESYAWVIAGPVYWFTMSAQTKVFMDRCFALTAYDKNGFKDKRIGIAMAYGDSDPFNSGCVNALRSFQDAYNYVGAKLVGMVYGSALGAGDIAANEALMEEAKKLGKKLVTV